MPPVLYIYTLQGLEFSLHYFWGSELRGRLITDPQEILSGRVSIREEIRKNVDAYLDSLWLVKLGPVHRVEIKTETGQIIYPPREVSDEFSFDYAVEMESIPDRLEQIRVAQRNVEILQEGLTFSLQVRIPRNSWLANIVLLLYIFIFATILSFNYRSRMRTVENYTSRQEGELQDARQRLTAVQSRLEEATLKETSLRKQIAEQQKELDQIDRKLQSTESEALEEMETLEELLGESLAEKQKKEDEMASLLQEVERLKSDRQVSSRKKSKQYANIQKRFKVLYKNIDFHERALHGVVQLPQDLELKAEEMVHTLNQDCSLVKVKRKVFSGKGNDLPVLESIFAYRGRIYWRKNRDARIEVMVIGTKNTQDRDLAYLEGLG